MPRNMHSNKRQKFSSFTRKTLSAAVVSAVLFSSAYAAGLGKLTVLSSLGQPLRAEIELTSVSKDEVGALVAKLASSEAFRQANIEFNPSLLSLRFAVEQRAGKQIIRISSSQPLNEPFVDMLLELGGPNGRLIREYTFLLDPADMRSTQSAQVAPLPVPQVEAGRGSQAIRPAEPPRQAAPADSPRPAPRVTARPAAPTAPVADAQSDTKSDEYKVKNGDSLAKIANQVRSSGVSLDQMLVALYRANPNAFIDKNMNRLRAGQVLSVPSEDAARGINTTEARGIVVAQSADFRNYRSKLAGQVATADSEKSADSRQTSAGKITAKVEEPATPANQSQDKLQLSKSAVPNAVGGKAGAGAAGAEDTIAREKAVAEANARVKELEKNVTDLQKLLEVKNQGLAEQQKQADTKSAVAPVAQAPAAPVPTAPAPTAPAPAAQATAPTTPAAPAVPPASTPAAPTASTEAPATDKPAEAKTDQPASAAAPAAPEAAAEKPAAPAAQPAPAPVEEPGFLDELLDNPLVLPGGVVLLAALGALGIMSARRRKQQKNFDDSIITDSSLKANSLFGSTGGQSVDTNNSVFNSNFSATASQLDSNEVDPVAEADVYIAYGRDAQAEEILKEALRTQPDRHAVRVKLLEIYSNRKDLRAFEVLATELYGMTKGQGEDWAQAATLGAAIDPDNPLYAAGKSGKSSGAESVAPVAAAQPLSDPDLATLLASTQTNTSFGAIDDLGADAAYFTNPSSSGSKKADEPVLDVPTEQPAARPATNDLDFDLDGLSSIEVPNTIARPAPSEPNVDLGSIDFDFLQEPNIVPAAPMAAPASTAVPAFHLDDVPAPASKKDPEPVDSLADLDAPLSMDFPGVPQLPAAEFDEPRAPTRAESAPVKDPVDFDLSDISLELGPTEAESKPDLALDTGNVFGAGMADSSSSTDAEMATKLDLAIDYQEIGDKEGARELLDEVLKGGNAEQSEKARSLLHELA
ncbi:MAG: LysM peptidoglycan-binding protein [Burkholderia sp.]|nr:LysM peptidoglycan-binding protein [Burkholderia sp.]